VTRLDRSEAAREVISATQRLSDGLAVEENRAFARIAEELRAASGRLERRVRGTAATRGRVQVWLDVDQLLPTNAELRDALMPIVGDLLAITRDRTMVVVRRQMRACGESVSRGFVHLQSRGVAAAKALASPLEEEWFGKSAQDCARAYLDTRARMRDQVERWYGRNEAVDQLVLRLVAEDTVTLPGSDTRGALWALRAPMNLSARSASVALTNGLLLAAMGGWNEAASATG
jgi:hypothetical protein